MPVWQPAIPQGLRPHLLSWVGYDFTSTDTVHHGVPSMGVTVVLSLAEPIDCGWLHGDARHLCDLLVSGLHTTPALIQSRGRQQGLELSLHPLSTRRLLGLPAGELAGSMVDVNDLSWPRHLLDQLRQSTWPRRFHLLAAFLTKRLEQHPHAPRADLVEALARIHRTQARSPSPAWLRTLACPDGGSQACSTSRPVSRPSRWRASLASPTPKTWSSVAPSPRTSRRWPATATNRTCAGNGSR